MSETKYSLLSAQNIENLFNHILLYVQCEMIPKTYTIML